MAVFFISSMASFIFFAKKDEDTAFVDEREEKIGFKVDSNAFLVIYAGLICLMWFVFTPMEPMQVANAILGIICITEAFKIFIGLRYLRSGT